MTAQEMGIEVAKAYIEGNDEVKAAIMEIFTEEEREIFQNFLGFYQMFMDPEHYKRIKNLTLVGLLKEFYGA